MQAGGVDAALQAPKLSEQLTFISAWYCPYAQRTWIALLEKGVPFTLRDVAVKDPATGEWGQLPNKPAWYLELNPNGKVPVLAYKEEDATVHAVYESLICNEFLEDYQPEPALLPPHPAVRARARILIDRFNSQLVPLWYRLLMRQDPAQQAEAARGLADELAWLEAHTDPLGPYLMGSQFSLADAAVLPWFLRMYVLKHFRGFELPAGCVKLARWYAAAAARPAVQQTMQPPEPNTSYEEALLGTYKRYADGRVG